MKERLLAILKRFRDKKILVIGDIMLDKYIWGDVSRISPEAPVQVVHVIKETYAPGGASNVANNAAALNGKVAMVGIAGNDVAKNVLVEELKKIGIDTKGIFIDKDKPTIQKVRIVGKGQQLLRVDYEIKEHIHKDIENEIIRFLEKNLKDFDVIVVSDYAKGVMTYEISKNLIELARKNSKPVIANPKPKNKDLYSNVTLITPNNKEAGEMTGMEDGADEAVLATGSKLVEYLNCNVLITRGEKGMSLFDKNGNAVHIPAKAKEVYSLIGAGDTVIATISMAIAAGADLKDAAFLSNVAAGIKVGKVGTATVTIDEITREIENLEK